MAIIETNVGQPRNAGIASERTTPRMIPTVPPVRLSTIDSIKNWLLTADERAPMAMRIPISRVRSVTDTSMMFMMPIPPTSSDTPAIHASRIVIVLLVSFAASATSVMFRTVKSFGSLAVSL